MTKTTPSPQTIKQIAEGLTKAQREILGMPVWSGWKIFTWWPEHQHHAMQRLQIEGLFDRAPHWNSRWNDLGLQVRAHLEQENRG